MVPDIEKVIAYYLRNHDGVTGTGARVVGKTPEDLSKPWVRVIRLDGQQNDPADHVTGFLVQLDCYAGKGGGQPEANLIGRTVRAALRDMPGGSHTGAVVTATRVVGDARIPDPDISPTRERVVLTVEVVAHAAPAGSGSGSGG